jgi:predicted ATP-dependent endonuclease of OLD family
LFLFDEPAANLHAAAQQKLIESFPEIADGPNMLIYTTHSHYMVEPAWLELTFIITNRSESPVVSIVDSALLDDESLDVTAHKYRQFINDYPNNTSYFQPIVDRLEVVPSKFDYNLPSIVLEGKSDYYILSYAQHLFGLKDDRLIPAVGAGTFSALIGLAVGWGIKFLFVLDADKQGEIERSRYAVEHGAPLNSIFTLSDFVAGTKVIEDLLDLEARAIISDRLGISGKPTKKQILQFFQESLAKREVFSLGDGFASKAKSLLVGLSERLRHL